MNKKQEKLLRQYLDQELTGEQEREILHVIADDPELRSMLNFERELRRYSSNLTDAESFEVPSGFSSSVMDALEKKYVNEHSQEGVLDKLNSFFISFWKPKQVFLRPVYGLVMLLIIIVFIWPYFVNNKKSPKIAQNITKNTLVENVSAGEEQVWTRFVYIDNNAKSISVAGDFNNWNSTALTKKIVHGKQVWTGLIPMGKGEHHYMFVKNGDKWVTDPLAPIKQDDGFGNKNAVIYL